MSKQYALFIGRWQNLHEGHRWLFRQKIEQGIPVLVAIRDIQDRSEQNPKTSAEILQDFHNDAEMSRCMSHDMMRVIIIPDIMGVYYGRGVGYEVEELVPPGDIAEISGTAIREKERRGDGTK